MQVVLIETEGRGGIAEIEVVAPEPASWERAFAQNRGNETRIEPLFGWRHLGFRPGRP